MPNSGKWESGLIYLGVLFCPAVQDQGLAPGIGVTAAEAVHDLAAGIGTGTGHVPVTGLVLMTGLVLTTQDQDPSPRIGHVHAQGPGIRSVARATADPVAAREVILQSGTVIVPAPVASPRRDTTEMRGLILVTPGRSLEVPPGNVLLLPASTALLLLMKICGHGVPHLFRMDMMNEPKLSFDTFAAYFVHFTL